MREEKIVPRIGYACLTVGVEGTQFKTLTLKNATPEKITAIISHNLDALEAIIDYNGKNGIRLFRITSDLIPLSTLPQNTVPWATLFQERFAAIGTKIKKTNQRVSMHPGQYTVLNSPDENVVGKAIEDLEYHATILELLGCDQTSKIILHVGGAYGDKIQAMERFKTNYLRLSDKIKKHLVIENDDRVYTIEEVLTLGEALNIPVVYDNLHDAVNPSPNREEPISYWVDRAEATWKKADGRQKTHYSQQDPTKHLGAHSATIDLDVFMQYVKNLGRTDLDFMLEVKDKNISALKCHNAFRADQKMIHLENEWARYKYLVLAKSPKNYQLIRTLLNDKRSYPVELFYRLVDEALNTPSDFGHEVNALEHIWGYFKTCATETERRRFEKLLEEFKNTGTSLPSLKNHLYKLATVHHENYLLQAYYFNEIR